MQRPILCYTGRQANVSIYRQEHHHAAEWSSLLQPLQDRRKGRRAPSWRACCEQRRVLPPSSQQPWEGGGTPALSSWEERLYKAAGAWPSALRAPGDAEEGRSAGRPIGRAAEPVCVQTSRDHRRGSGRSAALATRPRAEARPAVVGLEEARTLGREGQRRKKRRNI